MKSRFCFILIMLCVIQTSWSQIKGSFDLASTWSFDLETPGVNIRSYIFVGDRICFGPEFTHFFYINETHANASSSLSVYTIDLNAHYGIPLGHRHKLGIYPIVGIDFTREKEVEKSISEEHTEIIEALGFNLGLGFEKPLSHDHRVNMFTEFIHTFSLIGDNVFFLGINYHWGGKKKAHKE